MGKYNPQLGTTESTILPIGPSFGVGMTYRVKGGANVPDRGTLRVTAAAGARYHTVPGNPATAPPLQGQRHLLRQGAALRRGQSARSIGSIRRKETMRALPALSWAVVVTGALVLLVVVAILGGLLSNPVVDSTLMTVGVGALQVEVFVLVIVLNSMRSGLHSASDKQDRLGDKIDTVTRKVELLEQKIDLLPRGH